MKYIYYLIEDTLYYFNRIFVNLPINEDIKQYSNYSRNYYLIIE